LRNGKRDIYFNYSSDYGATWQVSDTRLDIGDTQGVSDSWYPEISNDNSGHIYVTWRDQRDGEPDIYFDTLSSPTTNTNVVTIEGGLNDITPPSIPANLTATAFSQSEINLSWDASTDDICVTGYNIYRDGVGTPIATTAGTTYQDTGLSPATFYTYNVSAIDAVPNESSQSLPASDTTDAPETTPPSTPANLTATAVSPYQIDLSWDASTDDIGVTGYNIYRDGGETPIATTTGTTYQDTGLSPVSFNTYNVSAKDFSGNESAQSSQASDITFTPDGTSPSTPANLTAPPVSPNQIDFSGDASTDDTTALTATAQLVSLSLKKKKGCFRVDFTATANCDANPDLVATLNGYPVTNGQIVELKRKKKFKVKIKGEGSSNDDSNSHDDDSRGRRGGKGNRCAADVRFEGPSFTLNVTATDVCGNVDIVSVNHVFDDGSGHKKKKKKKKK
jgi:chitodextrinase